MSVLGSRRGATFADGLIFLATLSLAAALLYPVWSAYGFRSRLSAAAADVDALATAATTSLQSAGRWPAPAAPGEAPPELTIFAGESGVFSRLDYRIGWTSWNVVDSVEAPPELGLSSDPPSEPLAPVLQPVVRSIGAVTVHASEPALLAELVERFPDETSFVLDSMWMLVLPARSEVPLEEQRRNSP